MSASASNTTVIGLMDNQRRLHLQEQDVLHRTAKEHIQYRAKNTNDAWLFRQEYFMVFYILKHL